GLRVGAGGLRAGRGRRPTPARRVGGGGAAGRGAAARRGGLAGAAPPPGRGGVPPPMALDVHGYLAARRRLVEGALARRFPARGPALRRAIRYSLLGGGKRLRPILALAAGEVAGAAPRTVLPFACPLELVHPYSLVHAD